MIEYGGYDMSEAPRRRKGAPRRSTRLTWALVLLVPALALAQSADLVRSYQNFEAAKAADKVADALKFGDEALKLTEQAGDRQTLIELLRNLGDFAAQSAQDAKAAEYYTRALTLQEAALGPNHPDLVPVLTSLADLDLKAKRYADAAAREQRILGIERQVYGQQHENVLATQSKLREIYRAANDNEAIARLDAEAAQLSKAVQPPPAGTRAMGPHGPGAKTAGNRYSQNGQGFASVRVFYGTNRAPTGDVKTVKPALYYGKERGQLQYGYLDVTIPKVHREAELETQPRWMDYTFTLDQAAMRSNYILLDKITPLEKPDFVNALRQQIKSSPSKDLFIFVHGFNNTFEDAARRVAQLAYDLDFDGTPLLYSWPSQGSATAYAVDEAAVGISGRKMADFLETVVDQSGAERIHVLAHSMGNRALIEALQTYLAKRAPENRRHIFGQIVFTAPDVDKDYFMDVIPSLQGAAERVTLYASSNDYALRSSQIIHGAPRAGNAGDSIIIRLAGLDTIDMSAVPADALGHSYFAANSGAIYDIFRLLWRGDPPPQRCGMNAHKVAGSFDVWYFNADACKGDELLEAGVLLKRFGDLAVAQVQQNIALLTDPSQLQQKQEWQAILGRLNSLLPPPAGTTAGGAAK
jgi:esterase/lipase superfamily enzyme